MVLIFPLLICFTLHVIHAEYSFETKYLDVPIDHFSYLHNTTFKLRYLLNGHYHVKGGPAFVYTGNEGDINMFAQNTGFLFDIAPTFNALIVFIEHRYYGESLPFGNLSLSSPEHLRYLTTSQALADFVHIIDHLKNTYFSTTIGNDTLPFIAFGGSYGGMLAAWLRMKYPHSVLGAIASSAPIWFFGDIVPCEKFYAIITEVFEKFGGEHCTSIVKASWSVLRNVTSSSKGKDYLSSAWNLCSTLKTSSDTDKLIDWVSDIYVNMAMTNYHYPTDFITPLPAYSVKLFCDKLTSLNASDSKSLLENLSDALTIYTNYTGKNKCNNINSTSDDLGERAWNYQTCTELIMPMCSTDKDMFENSAWDMKKHSETCQASYGAVVSRPTWAIQEYGGKNLRYFSNIVFSNGLDDPWSCGGVLGNISSKVWAVNITDGAHHVDLRGSHPADTRYVKDARKFHVNAIKKWLGVF
ncbi:unnamed protein product [Phaedon cochleariae]|uniref:Lysosomal Pro-X carboxypeptidase n=1 Tax=Phaedon cochleariae TaxID=80249 RepID=A0A9P0GVQ0_PHACE|nr:unnamed protein product [Phaedon cochleariae]